MTFLTNQIASYSLSTLLGTPKAPPELRLKLSPSGSNASFGCVGWRLRCNKITGFRRRSVTKVQERGNHLEQVPQP
eukprot:3699861-Amphidinium_carterae.1